MPKNLIIYLGVIVAVMPFITIPSSWKNPVYVLIGASIAYLYYRERGAKKKTAGGAIKRIRRPVGPITPLSNTDINPPENEPKQENKEN